MTTGKDIVDAVHRIERAWEAQPPRQETVHICRIGSPSFALCGNSSGQSEVLIMVMSPDDHVIESFELPVPAAPVVVDDGAQVSTRTYRVPTCGDCMMAMEVWKEMVDHPDWCSVHVRGISLSRFLPIQVMVRIIREFESR